jgi:hypothetical protein
MPQKSIFAALLLVATPLSAAPDKPVSLKDASSFATTLREMGYPVENGSTESGMPQLITTIGGLQTSITILGCTNGRNCSHIFLSSSYSDVINPPDGWISQMNDNFDFLKVGKSSDNALFFSTAHFVEGLPRSTMKTILDGWAADTSALADAASEAKLVQ